MKVTCHDSFDAVAADDWNQLVGRDPRASVFQRHEWHRAWLDAFGDAVRPRLIVASDPRGLRAIGPWCVTDDGVLRFIGDGHSDYVDVIAGADDAEAVAAVWRALEEEGGWQRAEWRHVLAGGHVAAYAARAPRTLTSPVVKCPRLELTDPEVARGAANRKSLRRHWNFFARQSGFQVTHRQDAAAIEPALPAFFDQHVARWADSPTPSRFRGEPERAFYRAMVRRFDGTGLLTFTTVAIDEGPVAFHLGFDHRDTFVWYKPSYDVAWSKKSPGEVLLKALFERAIESERRWFDFTIGSEAFKFRFATDVREAHVHRLFRSELPYRRALLKEQAKSAVKRIPGIERLKNGS